MKTINIDDLLAKVCKNLGIGLAPIGEEKRLTFPEGLKYKYWHRRKRKKRYMFCYSSTKNANGKYTSWIYWPTKQGFDLRRLVEHRTKKKAIERAYRIYQNFK